MADVYDAERGGAPAKRRGLVQRHLGKEDSVKEAKGGAASRPARGGLLFFGGLRGSRHGGRARQVSPGIPVIAAFLICLMRVVVESQALSLKCVCYRSQHGLCVCYRIQHGLTHALSIRVGRRRPGARLRGHRRLRSCPLGVRDLVRDPETRNQQLETRNLKPETRNSKPEAQGPLCWVCAIIYEPPTAET